jgi:hypothetical protein
VEQLTVPKIEAECHALTANPVRNRLERRPRRQGLESDDDLVRARREHGPRGSDGRDSGVGPQRRTAARNLAGDRRLWLAIDDGVEVGDIQLANAQAVDVHTRKRRRVSIHRHARR